MIWNELTSAEIARLDRGIVVVLPLAASEQHGPHLPVGTDVLIVRGICRALNDAGTSRVLILPAPPVGYSAHHRGFAGTLSVGHNALLDYAGGIADSVLTEGFGTLLVLNGHGGNVALGGVLLESLGEKFPGSRILFTSWWQVAADRLRSLSETGPGGTGHACEFETSLMMCLHPELVRTSDIAPGTNVPTHAWAHADMLTGSPARLHRSFSEMTRNGVFGDPTAASPGKGRKILSAVVESLGEIIADLQTDQPLPL